MTLREYELREARRFGAMAAAFVAIAVLQAVAGRWWVVVMVGVLALLLAVGAWLSWSLARNAEPWQEPYVKRPRGWELWLDGGFVVLDVGLALGALVDGRPLDAASWLLAAGVMWVMFTRTRERRRLTEPAKAPVRPGPPEEWIP